MTQYLHKYLTKSLHTGKIISLVNPNRSAVVLKYFDLDLPATSFIFPYKYNEQTAFEKKSCFS